MRVIGGQSGEGFAGVDCGHSTDLMDGGLVVDDIVGERGCSASGTETEGGYGLSGFGGRSESQFS